MSEAAEATRAIGAWAAGLQWASAPPPVRERLLLVLRDTLGVMVRGARLPELAAVARAWEPPPGPAPVAGLRLRTTPDAAAWFGGVAVCSLELDEGNKHARGHPAAHGFPAILAMAATLPVPGREVCAALLAAYEVAARFGRATRLRPTVHPHGSWGTAGAAAGVARLLGLGAEAAAAAIDAACGLAVAAPFETALSGNEVRNAWVGASNAAGIIAARLAVAGLARCGETSRLVLGELLGTFEPGALTAELGDRYDVVLGYGKRHASCSYTHPPIDAVLALRRRHPELRPERIVSIRVETHRLAAGLDRTNWPTRLAAMFSIPYVVAAALVRDGDHLEPDATAEAARDDPSMAALARRVDVEVAEDLDRRLPAERAARVTVTLDDGRSLVEFVPNPIGDADHHPLGSAEVDRKLTGLIGSAATSRLSAVIDMLPAADSAAETLAPLGEI